MDYDHRFASVGNSSTALGVSTVMPQDNFFPACYSFHFMSSSSVIIFHSCCSHVQVFVKHSFMSFTFPIAMFFRFAKNAHIRRNGNSVTHLHNF